MECSSSNSEPGSRVLPGPHYEGRVGNQVGCHEAAIESERSRAGSEELADQG
jgi:hypothetical protein